MSEPEAAPVYVVRYQDPASGYTWEATFQTDQEALDQAAIGVLAYGGVAPQEIVDGRGAVVYDQAAIIARSEELPG